MADSLNPVVDPIRRTAGVEGIPVRDEQLAAFAAAAEGQLTNG